MNVLEAATQGLSLTPLWDSLEVRNSYTLNL